MAIVWDNASQNKDNGIGHELFLERQIMICLKNFSQRKVSISSFGSLHSISQIRISRFSLQIVRKEMGTSSGKMTLPIFFDVLGDEAAQVFLEDVNTKISMEYI